MELIGGVGDCLGSLSVAWWVSMALGWAGTSSMLWQDSVFSWTALSSAVLALWFGHLGMAFSFEVGIPRVEIELRFHGHDD